MNSPINQDMLNSMLDPDELRKNYDVEIIRGEEDPSALTKPFTEATECLVGFGVWDLGFSPDDFRVDADGNFIPDNYTKVLMEHGDKVVFTGTEENIQHFKSLVEKFPVAEEQFQPRWVDPASLQITTNMEFFDDITLIFYPVRGKEKIDNIYPADAYLIRNRYLAQTLRSIGLYIWENANSLS